jgi:hypothetical protein
LQEFVGRTTPALFDRDDWRVRLRRGMRASGARASTCVGDATEEADAIDEPAATDAKVGLTLLATPLQVAPSAH